jgi:hypothetical protein
MWVANLEEVNLAFEQNTAALEWLKPYPPGVMSVGPGVDVTAFDAVAAAVVKRASQSSGPVDDWFRRFKIER